MWCIYVTDALVTGFETVGTQLMIVQTVAVMEIIHPLVGLVKTSAIAPFLQVSGIVIFLLDEVEELHSSKYSEL